MNNVGVLQKISMQEYQNPGAKIYSGRQYGAEVRNILGLNQKDKDSEIYTLSFPEDTISINPSYFGGLFEESVLRLGEDGFQEKYRFLYENGEVLSKVLQKDIEEGIRDVLKEF